MFMYPIIDPIYEKLKKITIWFPSKGGSGEASGWHRIRRGAKSDGVVF